MPDTKPRFLPILLTSVLLLAAFGAAGYFFYRLKNTQQELAKLKNITERLPQNEAQKIVEKVGKLMDLPTDEQPVVATVADLEPLKQKPFFAKAKEGDKVLIYMQARKAILYDPKANKILEVGGIALPTVTPNEMASGQVAAATTSATAIPTSSVNRLTSTFVLRNGTQLTGLTRLYEKELKKILPDAVVSAHENASKKDYQKTVLIDVKGDKETEAKQIATALGISVASLPEGENKPDSDFLIIVGDDKKNLWLSNL